VDQEPSESAYRVFTRDFDVEVEAKQLDTVLGPLSAADRIALDEAWLALAGALVGWRTKVHLAALESAVRIKNAVGADDLEATAVTLLIDQSGSMRGQSMLLAAAVCPTILSKFERVA
jgi:cobalamin biosynthesis protein CobT